MEINNALFVHNPINVRIKAASQIYKKLVGPYFDKYTGIIININIV